MFNAMRRDLLSLFLLLNLLIGSSFLFSVVHNTKQTKPTEAFTTGMSASVVIGQSVFTSIATNQGGSAAANTLNNPVGIATDGTRLFIADSQNNRVLIYNTIPTSNNASADVVIGQTNFSNTSPNQGGLADANTLRQPTGVATDGTRLFIADYSNNRILIFNTIPTSNNASADVVIGQSLMTGSNSGHSSTTLQNPMNVAYDAASGKLLVTDYGNSRVLIFNSVPTSNNASADVALCSPTINDYGNGGYALDQCSPYSARIIGGKVVVPDSSGGRMLIWNTVPTQDGTPADYIFGAGSNTVQGINYYAEVGGQACASCLYDPTDVAWDGKRLFVKDQYNSRILIFDGVPSSNFFPAYQVIGQTNFTGKSQYQGGTYSADGLGSDDSMLAFGNNKLFVIDFSRVLIFDNIPDTPTTSLDSGPESLSNGQLRFRGTATVSSPYTVAKVEDSVNSGPFYRATATDGDFGTNREDYYFDFNEHDNNYAGDGYTIQIKTTNNNLDTSNQIYYFQPFALTDPPTNTLSSSTTPSFSFSINKGRFPDLKNNLSKFIIQVKKDGKDWQTYIDNIPVSYDAVRNYDDNLQKSNTETNGNGTYETKKLTVEYTDNNANIKVSAKEADNDGNYTDKYFYDGGKRLPNGVYEWKAAAVDRGGHSQYTQTRVLRMGTAQVKSSRDYFPLSILSISGYGTTNISTDDPNSIKSLYPVYSQNPTFFGIATVNGNVSLDITAQSCESACTQHYFTQANSESRWGINLPENALISGQKYDLRISVSLEGDYNELPVLKIYSLTNATTAPEDNISATPTEYLFPTEAPESPAIFPSPTIRKQGSTATDTPAPTKVQTIGGNPQPQRSFIDRLIEFLLSLWPFK